jgi:dihydroneopterin aldolase
MKIIIEDLKFRAILGVLQKERTAEQAIEVYCEIDYKYDGRAYLDYEKIAIMITRTIKQKKFRLIEDALIFLATRIKDKYDFVESLTIRISKPEILSNCKVSAELSKKFS